MVMVYGRGRNRGLPMGKAIHKLEIEQVEDFLTSQVVNKMVPAGKVQYQYQAVRNITACRA